LNTFNAIKLSAILLCHPDTEFNSEWRIAGRSNKFEPEILHIFKWYGLKQAWGSYWLALEASYSIFILLAKVANCSV